MGKRVVAVDDDPCMRALLREVLGLGNYRVATACAHDQAIARIRAARPDLLILDLVLGEPSGGWAILEEVRRDPALATLPVILCTADIFGVAAREGEVRRHGAEVLIKPFHVADLLGLAERLIGPA